MMRLVEREAEAYLDGGLPSRPYARSVAQTGSERARRDISGARLPNGYRAMVERHLSLAQRVARQVQAAPNLELLADVTLNVVCFRFRPPGVPEEKLDELNRKLGEMVLEDGRVYFGRTDYAGKVAFRPAIVNWRTREQDVDLIVQVVRELGARLVQSSSGTGVG